MGRKTLMEVLPPLDWELVGGEQIGGLRAASEENRPAKQVAAGLLSGDASRRKDTWEGIFRAGAPAVLVAGR